MKTKLLLSVFVLAFAFITAHVNAQDTVIYVNSGELIEKAVKLYKDDKYRDAINIYKQIPRSDTNYVVAIEEISSLAYLDSSYKEAQEYSEKGLELFPDKRIDFYNELANALDAMNMYDSAIACYNKILQQNPHYYVSWFNKGISYYRQEKYLQADTCFQNCLLIYPFYSQAHYFLGLSQMIQGNLPQAMLSLSTCLLIDPDNKYNSTATQFLSRIASVNDEVSGYVSKRKKVQDQNFEDAQEIIEGKLAFDAKYKLKTSVEDPITRQLQVLLEKTEFNASDKNFWMQFYMPYYSSQFEKKNFDILTNYIFSGLDIKSIKEYMRKNKKDADDFINEGGAYFNSIKETRTLDFSKRESVSKKYYFSGKQVLGYGEWHIDKDHYVFTGPWEFYYDNGRLKSKGRFDDEGKQQGDWIYWYANGQQKQKVFFSDNVLQGKGTTWFDNGNIYAEENYSNGGLLNGVQKYYFYNGLLRKEETYRDDKRNGPAKGYTSYGYADYTSTYGDDKENGNTKYFYPNGKVRIDLNFINGKYDGPYKKYNEDGVLIMTGQYANDKPDGAWKEYYSSGKIYAEYTYTDGDLTGTATYYYENGKTEQTIEYAKGKLEGKEEDYDDDGVLYRESKYERGRLRDIRFLNKKGNEVYSATTRNGSGNLVFYDAEGNKASEGYFTKEGYRDGKTTYYYANGKVSSEVNYKGGLNDGEKTAYYVTGAPSSRTNYKDDKEDGLSTSWYQNGKKYFQGWQKEDMKDGEQVYWNVIGMRTSSISYLNNDESGYAVYYIGNNKKDYEDYYENGWLKRTTQFDTLGNIMAEYKFPAGSGDFTYKH